MGEGGDGFHDDTVGVLGGDCAGSVVGRGDFHDVHGN